MRRKTLTKTFIIGFRIFFLIIFPISVTALFIIFYGTDTLLLMTGFTQKSSDIMVVREPLREEAVNTEKDEVSEIYNMESNDEPIDFLEEVLPLLTPDPSRTSHPVIPTDASGSGNIDGVSVKDTADSGLNLSEELKKDIDLGIEHTDEPTVLIYHTHSCESYTDYFKGFYYGDESFRNTDPSKNVSLVGESMKKALEEHGIKTIHDTTIHDAPAFNGAYDRSAETVQKYLDEYPSIKITIDVHRDAMVTDTGDSYKPTTEIDGKNAAQMMIIAGCDPDGELDFDNWHPNLLFALKLQKKGEETYGGLMRPLMFCRRSYNMWLTDSSFLVEVGTESNTYSEAEYSGSLMGNILSEVILENTAN